MNDHEQLHPHPGGEEHDPTAVTARPSESGATEAAAREAAAREEAARWVREGDPSLRGRERHAAGERTQGAMRWVRATELFARTGDLAATKVTTTVVESHARLMKRLGVPQMQAKAQARARARWQQLTQRRADRMGPAHPIDPEARRVAIRMSVGR